MTKHWVWAITILISYSCSDGSGNSSKYKVEYAGALKEIMHNGQISAQANVSNFRNTDHFYALGAVENLKGELLILDSEPYVASVKNQELIISNSFNYKATLLVYCSVENWSSFIIPNDVLSYKSFEKYVENTASRNGIDTDKPFPFMVEGIAASFDWHVIDWNEEDTIHSHEKHKKSGLYGTENNMPVELLGFYSKHHHAVFTHHSTNMHIHVKTNDERLSGHVDELTLGPEMTLKLPDIK